MIETGRFNNDEIEKRICKVCDTNYVEDEFHFICICTAYQVPRKMLYDNVNARSIEFIQMRDKEKFNYLFQNEWKILSRFMEDAWNIRTNLLYK